MKGEEELECVERDRTLSMLISRQVVAIRKQAKNLRSDQEESESETQSWTSEQSMWRAHDFLLRCDLRR